MTSKNKTKYLILGLLSESAMSGYEIKKVVDLRFSYFWNESFGQIYPQLRAMEKAGLVTSEDRSNQTGKVRHAYSITGLGMEQLKKWLRVPVEKEVIRYEILLKMYFSNLEKPEVMMGHIVEFRNSHRKQYEIFRQIEQQLKGMLDEHENHREILMVLLFGQKIWRAYDEWCSEVLKLLQDKRRKLMSSKGEK